MLFVLVTAYLTRNVVDGVRVSFLTESFTLRLSRYSPGSNVLSGNNFSTIICFEVAPRI